MASSEMTPSPSQFLQLGLEIMGCDRAGQREGHAVYHQTANVYTVKSLIDA